MCWCAGNWAAVLCRRRRLVQRSGDPIAGKRIVVLKWDAVPVLDAGGLDAFQRFVNKLPEGCELRVSNLEFQPLRTLARARRQAAARTPELLPRSSGRAG